MTEPTYVLLTMDLIVQVDDLALLEAAALKAVVDEGEGQEGINRVVGDPAEALLALLDETGLAPVLGGVPSRVSSCAGAYLVNEELDADLRERIPRHFATLPGSDPAAKRLVARLGLFGGVF